MSDMSQMLFMYVGEWRFEKCPECKQRVLLDTRKIYFRAPYQFTQKCNHCYSHTFTVRVISSEPSDEERDLYDASRK